MCIDKNGDYYDCNQNKTKFVQKVKTATKAAVAVLNGTAFAVDEKIKNQRLKICSDCEHIKRLNALPKGAPVSIGDVCDICECWLKGNRVTNLINLDFCKTCYAGTPEFVCPLTDENGNPTPKWGFEYGEFSLENQAAENVEELSEEKDL